MRTQTIALILLSALTACSVGAPDIPVRRFSSGDIPGVAAELREELKTVPPENMALVLNTLAQCETMLGDREAAWRHFEVAGRLMGNWQTGGGEEFAAIIGSESSKTYKGDPYEKGMNAFYAGLHYLWRGEPDNGRACFKRGILADGELGEDKFRADNVLLLWLAGRASRLMGLAAEAEDFFKEAREADAFAREHGSRGDGAQKVLGDPARGNVVFLVECGMGPEKFADGENRELARYRSRRSGAERVTIHVDGREVGTAVPLLDLPYQATTMGGTAMEGIRQGKAVFKTATTVTGIVLLHGAANDSGRGARDRAIAGGALLLMGMLTSTAADVRHWATLPETVHALPIDLPPGARTVELFFFDRNGASLPSLNQSWSVDVPESGEAYYLFRGLPGLDRLPGRAAEPTTTQKLPDQP
jgi:hypothetical protein